MFLLCFANVACSRFLGLFVECCDRGRVLGFVGCPECEVAVCDATIVRFLACTGLRWGEMAGLHVEHVDTMKRRVNVVQNAVTVGSFVEVGTPKTHEARTVPFPDFLDTELAAQAAGKPRTAILFGDGSTYMPLPRTGTGWFSRAVDRCIAADTLRAVKAAERNETPAAIFPRVTPHDLRHTAASLAISAGAHVKAVQRMLGHASAAMTLDTYADLFDDDLDDVAAALSRARSSVIVATSLPAEAAEE